MNKLLWTLNVVTLMLCGVVSSTSAQSTNVQHLVDELAVIRVTNEIDVAVDRAGWPTAHSLSLHTQSSRQVGIAKKEYMYALHGD